MGSIPLPFSVLIIFPIWHYLVSVAFVWPKFKTWKKAVSPDIATWRNFKTRVLLQNEPPHKLSPFWGTLKQVTSFLGGFLYLSATAGYY
jgi:hypothetical protein